MRTYFEYKILKEAENEASASASPPTGDSLPNTPNSLPSPSTGAPPGSLDSMGLGSLGGPPMPDSMSNSMPGMDMGMGMQGGAPGDQGSPKPLELKISNVWDAFEKLLKNKKQ